MASTTGNDVVFVKVLANGEGNIPDADEVMANFDKCNDKIFASATAPTSPYVSQMWFKTGVSIQIALRIYGSDSQWHAVMMNGAIVV